MRAAVAGWERERQLPCSCSRDHCCRKKSDFTTRRKGARGCILCEFLVSSMGSTSGVPHSGRSGRAFPPLCPTIHCRRGNEPRDEHSSPFEMAVSNAECISQDLAHAAGNSNSHAGDSRNMNRSPAILVGDHRPPLIHTCRLEQKGRKNHSVAKETIYLHSMRMQRGKLVFPISYASPPLLVSLTLFCHSFSNRIDCLSFLRSSVHTGTSGIQPARNYGLK